MISLISLSLGFDYSPPDGVRDRNSRVGSTDSVVPSSYPRTYQAASGQGADEGPGSSGIKFLSGFPNRVLAKFGSSAVHPEQRGGFKNDFEKYLDNFQCLLCCFHNFGVKRPVYVLELRIRSEYYRIRLNEKIA